jgi:hypothetical protein
MLVDRHFEVCSGAAEWEVPDLRAQATAKRLHLATIFCVNTKGTIISRRSSIAPLAYMLSSKTVTIK